MKQIVIATQNEHKVIEFKNMLEPLGYQVLTLLDFPEIKDIVEDGTTFEENAFIKAKTVSDILQLDVIADDSGLVVEALNGEPGIYSARYAGEDVSYEDNNTLLLQNMEGVINRSAYFITVMCYYTQHQEPRYFTGTLSGEIATHRKGLNGFGYDPIFVLQDGRHLAELSLTEKNHISHRAQSLKNLITYLKEHNDLV